MSILKDDCCELFLPLLPLSLPLSLPPTLTPPPSLPSSFPPLSSSLTSSVPVSLFLFLIGAPLRLSAAAIWRGLSKPQQTLSSSHELSIHYQTSLGGGGEGYGIERVGGEKEGGRWMLNYWYEKPYLVLKVVQYQSQIVPTFYYK